MVESIYKYPVVAGAKPEAISNDISILAGYCFNTLVKKKAADILTGIFRKLLFCLAPGVNHPLDNSKVAEKSNDSQGDYKRMVELAQQ
jgi:hypothetical protein